MMFLRGLDRLFSAFRLFGEKVILLIRYDDYTVANYYRKQGAKVGHDCRIEVRSHWFRPQLINIGDHVFIGIGVILHTYDLGAWILRQENPDVTITGSIVIEDNCMIGANVQLLPNVRIGKNSIVGAGSVVISDVPPNSVVMGVPARVVGSTLKYKDKHLALWKEQQSPK